MYKIKGLEKYRRPIPKLNDGQFKAIHDSLAKWQFLSWHPEGTSDNAPECECCKYDEKMEHKYNKKECKSCPIYKVTNLGACACTPWHSWSEETGYSDSTAPQEAEDEYHFLEGIYSIELHRRMKK